jgi:hypothetical protein
MNLHLLIVIQLQKAQEAKEGAETRMIVLQERTKEDSLVNEINRLKQWSALQEQEILKLKKINSSEEQGFREHFDEVRRIADERGRTAEDLKRRMNVANEQRLKESQEVQRLKQVVNEQEEQIQALSRENVRVCFFNLLSLTTIILTACSSERVRRIAEGNAE